MKNLKLLTNDLHPNKNGIKFPYYFLELAFGSVSNSEVGFGRMNKRGDLLQVNALKNWRQQI